MDTDHQIAVAVETSYIEAQSVPTEDRYVFAYTITIRNDGEVPARLLSRHWFITDATGKVQEVEGMGVVGEQPYLKPGEAYRYTSGVILETPVGSMEGSYRLVGDDELVFEAPIPPFTLALPHTLH
jgi:ApaG protein